jgi:hypothetical protein
MARRSGKLDRYFKRSPGALLAVRLTFFSALFLSLPAIAVLNGWIDITPRRRRRWWAHDNNIYFADRPILFTFIVGLCVAAALFMLTVSIIDYRKQRKRLSNDPKIVGLDAR